MKNSSRNHDRALARAIMSRWRIVHFVRLNVTLGNRFYGALSAGLIFAMFAACDLRAEGSVDSLLREWIEDDLHFLSDSNNNPKLAIRREPVRAHVYSEDRSADEDMRLALTLLSQASELKIEFTSVNPNSLAIVTSPINDGDKPNRALLKRLGLPDGAIDIVSSTGGWASGCGMYAFGDQFGNILMTLAFGDKHLPSDKLKDCVTEGILRGFGLRTKRSSTIRAADGYFHYLLLIKAVRFCDKELVLATEGRGNITALRRRYTDCASEFIKKVIAAPGGQ
jgi:hypothetical protein